MKIKVAFLYRGVYIGFQAARSAAEIFIYGVLYRIWGPSKTRFDFLYRGATSKEGDRFIYDVENPARSATVDTI